MPLDMDSLKRLAPVLRDETRYAPDAYQFIRKVVAETEEQIKRRGRPRKEHITVSELLHGLRDLALDEYGPMALTVLAQWGIHTSLDVGHIVFALERHKLLGLSDEDSIADFDGIFNLREELTRPFDPAGNRRPDPPTVA